MIKECNLERDTYLILKMFFFTTLGKLNKFPLLYSTRVPVKSIVGSLTCRRTYDHTKFRKKPANMRGQGRILKDKADIWLFNAWYSTIVHHCDSCVG